MQKDLMRGVMMARKKTKAYSEAFRKEAVRLADLPDRTATDVANNN
jgi:transposase